MTRPRSRARAAEPPPVDPAGTDGGDSDEDSDEFEERRWPLGIMLALAIGVWAGRAFYRLPDGLENLAGLALSLATAVILAGLYRRWVRRQFAEARERRQRRQG